MVTSIFTTIGEVVTKYVGILGEMFDGVIGIFWNATDSSLTLLGVLLLIGIGVGIVKWAFNLVQNLVRM